MERFVNTGPTHGGALRWPPAGLRERSNDVAFDGRGVAHRPAAVDLVIRATHDRALEEGERLIAKADAWPEAGRVEVRVEAKPGQKARLAHLALRFGPVVLRRSRRPAQDEGCEMLPVWLVVASWVMARLGGWNGSYGKPGPITILEGWMEFHSIKRGATLGAQTTVRIW